MVALGFLGQFGADGLVAPGARLGLGLMRRGHRRAEPTAIVRRGRPGRCARRRSAQRGPAIARARSSREGRTNRRAVACRAFSFDELLRARRRATACGAIRAAAAIRRAQPARRTRRANAASRRSRGRGRRRLSGASGPHDSDKVSHYRPFLDFPWLSRLCDTL